MAGEMPANVASTRAYVYLKEEEFGKAADAYAGVLDQDLQTAKTLLGAGIAHARLGNIDEALPLLQYGMEKFEEAEVEFLNPQLPDLLTGRENSTDGKEPVGNRLALRSVDGW